MRTMKRIKRNNIESKSKARVITTKMKTMIARIQMIEGVNEEAAGLCKVVEIK